MHARTLTLAAALAGVITASPAGGTGQDPAPRPATRDRIIRISADGPVAIRVVARPQDVAVGAGQWHGDTLLAHTPFTIGVAASAREILFEGVRPIRVSLDRGQDGRPHELVQRRILFRVRGGRQFLE